MLIIGLTGGLATGKSIVAAIFRSLGAKVIDADRMAHRMIRPGGKCFRQVVRIFGREILSRGRIDRRKLAEVVFQSPARLRQLEKIIHPQVIREIRQRIARYRLHPSSKAVVLDVPLLFESGIDDDVDFTVVVSAGRAQQRQRIRERLGLTPSQALARIRSQMPLSAKVRLADAVIDNSRTVSHTRDQVKALWAFLRARKFQPFNHPNT